MSKISLCGPSTLQNVRAGAFRLVAMQFVVAFVISLGWLFANWHAAFSALLGGISVVIPSFYFARRLFASMHASQVGRIIRAFYWGEFIKIILMAGLIIVLTQLFSLDLLPFFCGVLGAQMGYWLAAMFKA